MDDKTHAEAVPEQRTPPGPTPAAPAASPEATSAFDPPTSAEVTAAGPAPASEPPAGEAEQPAPTQDKRFSFLQGGTQPGSLGRLGHYEVLGVLGEGGFGIVLQAFDETLRRQVAIKVLGPQLAGSATARARFLREARAAAAVNSKHVVSTYAVNERPIPHLVMEYVAGKTLQNLIDERGPLEVRDILRIGAEIAEGLAAAHQQSLIHRDIKPGNILLEDGPQQRVKIADFGLARAVDDPRLTQAGVIAGTPMFMSPEQARGDPLDHRSDLFSLGSVLYAMCTGQPPFRAERTLGVLKRVCDDAPRPIREGNAAVPDALAAIVNLLLVKDPAGRFQTAAAVAELLAQHLAHLDDPALPAPPAVVAGSATASLLPAASARGEAVPAPTRKARRQRTLGLWAAAGGVLLAAVGSLLLFLKGGGHSEGDPRTPGQPAKLASLLDGWRRDQISVGVLALAGGGDPALAPPELVAVLGNEGRFRLPNPGLSQLPARTADGSLLAVSCGNDVALFDARAGKLLRVFRGHTARAGNPEFSTDGKWLACGSRDGRVRVWEVASARERVVLWGHRGEVVSVAFSPYGQRLASGCWYTGTVKVWDLKEGKEAFPVEGHGGGVPLLRYSPDGKILVSGAGDQIVLVRDAATGKTLHTLPGHTRTVHGLAFSADGKWLATGSDAEWKLWRTDTFEEVRSVDALAGWLEFAPDGQTLLTGRRERYGEGATHSFRRWDVGTGELRGEAALPSSGGWAGYLLSADGTTLFSMRGDPPEPFLRTYDARTGKENGPRPPAAVASVAFSPDGRWLASGGADRTVRLWDLTTGKLARTLARHADKVGPVAFSPDGALLASGSADGAVVLWDVVTGAEVRVLAGQAAAGSLLAFSPDGKTVAAGGTDGTVRLWDVAGGQPAQLRVGHQGVVRAVAFSPDGRLLASAGEDRTVRVSEVATGERLRAFRAPAGLLTLAFSADGQRVAAGTGAPDGAVHVWDLKTGKGQRQPAGGDVVGLAFQPGGRVVAVGTREGVVRLSVDGPANGPTLTLGPGPFGKEVTGLAFSPEGGFLAVAQGNGLISVLRVSQPPGDYRPGPATAPEPARLAGRASAADALGRADGPAGALPKRVALLSEEVRFGPTGGETHGMAVSKGGERLAVPCGRDLLIFDARTGKLLHRLPDHQSRALEAAFSPDGKRVACGSNNQAVRVWDVQSGRLELTLKGPAGITHGVAFSPDRKRLAAASWDATVRVWDAGTGENPLVLKGHEKAVHCVCFSPDSKWLVSGSVDGQVRVWEAATGKELHVLRGHTDAVRCLAFSPDGKWLATGGFQEAILWDAETFEARRTLAGDAGWLAFPPGGKALLTAPLKRPLGKPVRRWDVTTGEPLGQFLLPLSGDWGVYALSPDGQTLFATPWVWASFVRRYDAVTGKELAPQRADLGSNLGCVAVSPDGRLVAAGSTRADATTVGIFDLATGKLHARWPGHADFVRAVPFSPDGKVLASAGADGVIRLRDVETGKQRLAFRAHVGSAYSLAFSPDGTLLASGGQDRTARVWDVRSGRLVRALAGHADEVEGVAFSPDGKVLATAGFDRTVRLWDVASGWQLAVWTGHTDRVRCVAFHPGGKLLASGAVDRTVRLWDVTSGQVKQVLTGHAGEVVKVAWRADGRVLASCGGTDGTVRLWQGDGDSSRSKVLPLFRPGAGWVHGVAFTPEGRHVVTANPGGRIAVLRLARVGEVFEPQRGEDKPANVAERLKFAQFAYHRKQFAVATRLWAEALTSDPKLGDDRQFRHRYNAACAAALAAAGQGQGEPPLDDAAKARLRRQALDWLKAERTAWGKFLDSGPPQAGPTVAKNVSYWQKDADLAGIRDAAALAKLPAEERAAFTRLWADVAELLKRAEEKAK